MANQQIGGMKTLAQTLEVEGATNQLLCDIRASVESSKLNVPNDVCFTNTKTHHCVFGMFGLANAENHKHMVNVVFLV